MSIRLMSAAVLTAASVLVNVAVAAAPASQSARPNVLVIMTDEHNASVLGCYGNKIVRTPNMDRLASHGVLFEAAYTNSPLCVPSRLSFTSGKYVSRVGAWNNGCKLPSDKFPSIAHIMNDAGYQSYLCGKMHYDRNDRYGFTDTGRGIGSNHDIKTLGGHRRDPDDLAAKAKGGGAESGRFSDFHAGDESPVMRHDRAVTAGAVEFFSNRNASDKPFFLLVGYLAPHFPLIVPEKYVAPYRGRVPMPVIPPGYIDLLPLNYRHLRAGFNMMDVPPDKVREGRELYYGLTSWVDNEVGRVLSSLDESGLGENTVIIYTADHGENMGEHGLWWKNCVFDTAARVPLIVSYPQRWTGGQRRSGACSLVDVVQTIAELGGARVPNDWNGDSLCGYMDRPEAAWKDRAVTEYWAHNIASGYAMIRLGHYKYVYHTTPDAKHPAQRELYDLTADPGELTNLAGKPEQSERLSQMHAALIKELGEDPDKIELRCREDMRRGYSDAPPEKPTREKGQRKRARHPATAPAA
jgi:choline-sulfatase